jgi:hypothetical protein
MHKLKKPNGTEVEVSDSSLEYALSLGWKKVEKPAKKAPAKKTAKKAE